MNFNISRAVTAPNTDFSDAKKDQSSLTYYYSYRGDHWKIEFKSPAISAGAFHSLGVKSNGTLWTWGANNVGQLGDGSRNPRSSPIQIGAGTIWVKVAAGDSTSMALKTDGTVWAWGFNTSGQVGDSTSKLASASGLSHQLGQIGGRRFSYVSD